MRHHKAIAIISLLGATLFFSQASMGQGTLVQTIDASAFNPPSPDPAGVTWLQHTTGPNTILASDSEVNEIPTLFTGDNLFEIDYVPPALDRTGTTAFSCSTPVNYSCEPTGLAYDPATQYMFVTDDNRDRIFTIDPVDGFYGNGNDVIVNQPRIDKPGFGNTSNGSEDGEGITYCPDDGRLYVVDGVDREVYIVDPGPNGEFDGIPSQGGDDVVTQFDVNSIGMTDAEGIACDLDHPGHLYVSGEPDNTVFHVTTDGTLVRAITVLASARKLAGLGLAPSSLGGADPNPGLLNLYIADRGVDNNTDPDENDGKIYEYSLTGLFPGNTPPQVDAGMSETIIAPALPAMANLDGTVTDDGLPDPPATVTTLWTQVGGPPGVSFGDDMAVDTTATFPAVGVYVLRLTANDSQLAAFDDITITVQLNPGNTAPQVDAGMDETIILPTVVANLDGTVTDDGLPNPPATVDTLWTQVSGPVTVSFGDDMAVDTTATFPGVGVYVLRLTADDSVLTSFDEVTITVQAAPNDPPDVDAGGDQVITSALPAMANLDGTVTDDGLPDPPATVDTLWTQVSGPPGVTFDDDTVVDTTATFPAAGVYVLRLTADDSGLQAFDDVTITVQEPTGGISTVYVSTSRSADPPGLTFRDEDVAAYDLTSQTWSIYFDGSDVGLSASGQDIYAFHVDSDGSILMAINDAATLPDVGLVEPWDIVRFTPTSTGENNTAGTFAIVLDGSDVELGDTSGESIDAIGILPDGRIVISTRGSMSALGVSARDEDLVAFNDTQLGPNTMGSWELYFDGSDVELNTSDEDVNGVWVDSNGGIYLSTKRAFTVTGASGDGLDIFLCVPGSVGPTTSCTYSPFIDGSAIGLTGADRVDGISLSQ